MQATIVRNKKTGVLKYANYGANRLGNMRMWVDGKFLSDKDFDKNWEQVDRDTLTADEIKNIQV